MTTTAAQIEKGQTVRIESGPKAGLVGLVERVRTAKQLGTLFDTVIIDFAGGGRATRQASDPVTVLA